LVFLAKPALRRQQRFYLGIYVNYAPLL